MNLLMISGDRLAVQGKQGAFTATLEEFSKHFDRIDIICPRVTDAKVQRIGNVYFYPSPWGLLRQPKWILQKGSELIATHKHAVMTVHDYPPFYNGLGAKKLSKKTGVSAVSEIHHIVGYPRAASFAEVVGRIMTRKALPSLHAHFAAVRTVTQSVKNLLAEFGVEEKKVTVVPSVYLDHSLVEKVRNTPKKYDLVFSARLVDNKGLIPLLDAVSRLQSVTLLVIGDGPVRKKAEEKAKSLKISDRVTFTGWLPTADSVASAISSAKIFVMNSKSEGNPRVAVEAMAYGLPVIATKVGIMPDIVIENVNGLFSDGSSKDLVKKIESVIHDASKISSMGTEASKILAKFEKKTAIAAYANFLKSVQ